MTGADDRFLADGVYKFHDWFRNKLEANMPWDKLAYGVMCATAADDRDQRQCHRHQCAASPRTGIFAPLRCRERSRSNAEREAGDPGVMGI